MNAEIRNKRIIKACYDPEDFDGKPSRSERFKIISDWVEGMGLKNPQILSPFQYVGCYDKYDPDFGDAVTATVIHDETDVERKCREDKEAIEAITETERDARLKEIRRALYMRLKKEFDKEDQS